jgi:hypothetical protein
MGVFHIDGFAGRDIIATFLKSKVAARNPIARSQRIPARQLYESDAAPSIRREDTEKGGDVSDHTLGGKSATVTSRRGVQKDKKLLGTFYDQTFYATRHAADKALSFPFPAGRFNAMVCLAEKTDEAAMRRIGMDLLEHGLRFALCHGPEAGAMGKVLDELIDEHGFSCEGLTAYTSVHEDDSLAEAVEYFILPAGLAETSLLVVVGSDASYREVMKSFAKATSHLRERVLAK